MTVGLAGRQIDMMDLISPMLLGLTKLLIGLFVKNKVFFHTVKH